MREFRQIMPTVPATKASVVLRNITLMETRNVSVIPAIQVSSTTTKSLSLAPGELPGYTGWARPEQTLAGFFALNGTSCSNPRVGEVFRISLWCQNHEHCFYETALFFLRAYGPSVISGVIRNEKRGHYSAEFLFPDPGQYTVEVVLAFSNAPHMLSFPLPLGQPEPAYEGFLLPGFPLQVTVTAANSTDFLLAPPSVRRKDWCQSKDLLETSSESAIHRARWKVVKKSTALEYFAESPQIGKHGYLRNSNSLGVHMSYEYFHALSKQQCSLIPPDGFDKKRLGREHPFSKCQKKIHVVFIGDSALRVQKETFDTLISQVSNVETSFVSLHGGYRRVEKLESSSFLSKLADIRRRTTDITRVVLFNTGLHDIHRLCADEWRDDRMDYLDNEKLKTGNFSCLEEYQNLLGDLASFLQKNFPAELMVFQSTTAGWPKYGNYGIEWSWNAQVMPMATEAIPSFNEIAYNVITTDFNDSISIMDGYWITNSRPDNREIGPIGNKLSHPGLEVQNAMARIWAMIILDKVCGSL